MCGRNKITRENEPDTHEEDKAIARGIKLKWLVVWIEEKIPAVYGLFFKRTTQKKKNFENF